MKIRKAKIQFDIVTIFPNIFDSYLGESLLRRADEKGIIKVRVHNLRDYTLERHRKVDDRPFGGGPGMVLQVEPIYKAVSRLVRGKKGTRTILFSTRGKVFDATVARKLSKYKQIIFICGRYEGVDERVAEHIADEEISLGNFVLSGGELPALVAIEAISRFLPNFLGKYESLEEVKGSYPVYTRPEVFVPKKSRKAWRVPKILLSGNHKQIEKFRKK